jgi:hypothetical protein
MILSCNKSKNYTSVNGKVINIITKQPVDSVEVLLCDGLRAVGGNNENENCKTTFTDNEGNFKIDIESDEALLYFSKLDYVFNHYVEGSVDGVITPFTVNKNHIVEIEPKCGFAPWFLNNQSSQYDTLITNIGQNYRYKYSFHPSNDDYYYGKGPFKLDNLGYKIYVGDMYVIYRLRYKRNGNWNEKIDSVFVAQGKVYEDTIRY